MGLSVRTRALNAARGLLRGRLVDGLVARVTEGRSIETALGRLPPNHYQYPAPTWRSVTRRGIAYELDISDWMEWLVYFGVVVEPRDTLFDLARPGDTVLDVGTNIGEVLLNFARVVGEGGRVIGFEALPATYERCMRNVRKNDFRNVEVLSTALGDRAGEVTFGTPIAGNRGGNRVMDAGTTRVPMRTLDSVVREKALSRVDLIKLDVEGYELNVLHGASDTLARFHPRLFIELDDANLRPAGGSARELVTLLHDAGYAVTHAEEKRPVTADESFAGRHFDVVALWHG